METTPAPEEQKAPQTAPETEMPNSPIARDASWGAIISITIILAMIIVGAFYSWGQRLAQQNPQAAQVQNQ